MQKWRLERRFALADFDPYHNWGVQLSTSRNEARVLISRHTLKGGKIDIWIVDLLGPQQKLQRIPVENPGYMYEPSRDLRWLVFQSPGMRRKPVQIVDMRRLDHGFTVLQSAHTFDLDYVEEFSADLRWLALKDTSGKIHLIDLTQRAISGSLSCSSEFGNLFVILALGRNRPPLWIDREGNLLGFQGPAGSSGSSKMLLEGHKFTALAWDGSGEWLGIGDQSGRVWDLRPKEGASLAELRRQVQIAIRQKSLPLASDPETKGPVNRLFLFPEAGWLIGETESGVILMWRKTKSGDWDTPLALTKRDIYLNLLCEVRVRPDGRQGFLGGQIVDLDPEKLISLGRSLMSGRVR